ncbi:hypothetical protein [Rhodoferax sp.]|uniref:hypothetical protein n=1 Tax=Rhodoferax sp. TaxID=50421 RepID=UPI0027564CD7|nr:hypothetical protein [Rhodoferax sp.]MDP2443764.1 hypothetical protein [Rhodoferax sp.]MDZ4207786.1 hypothetical protein [Rhodoferax sp.]
MTPVTADIALFIKLGKGGCWAHECLENGTLRFGYQEIPHAVCNLRDWPEIRRLAREFSASDVAAANHTTQIRHFYEADKTVLWITFHGDRLWWCFSSPEVEALQGNEKSRQVIRQWQDCDIGAVPLLKSRLSSKLLSVQGFMQTICTVSELDYLLHKINGTSEPHVARAQTAFEDLQVALIPIIKSLHQNDLEILTDLIFRQAGWMRVGVTGGTERDIDLDLISPVTNERIAVQVKSRATPAIWNDYRERYADMRGFSRFYFVTHSPNVALQKEALNAEDKNYILWGVEQLALQAARCGLTGWLLDKAS